MSDRQPAFLEKLLDRFRKPTPPAEDQCDDVYVLTATVQIHRTIWTMFRNEPMYFRTLESAQDHAQMLYDAHCEPDRKRLVMWKKDDSAVIDSWILCEGWDGQYKDYNAVWRIEKRDMRQVLP